MSSLVTRHVLVLDLLIDKRPSVVKLQKFSFGLEIHNNISQYTSIMKRKLNVHDVPEEVETVTETKEPETQKPSTFEELGLDARLLQAIAKEKYATPTPIQAKAIPLALEGRDILGA